MLDGGTGHAPIDEDVENGQWNLKNQYLYSNIDD